MNRWQVILEITSDIVTDETPSDALQRVKILMNSLMTDEGIAHYHVVQTPRKVVEFD